MAWGASAAGGIGGYCIRSWPKIGAASSSTMRICLYEPVLTVSVLEVGGGLDVSLRVPLSTMLHYPCLMSVIAEYC